MKTVTALSLACALAACGDDRHDPGVLVAVSMHSTIGVLVDEVPEPARTRLVQQLVAKPTEFWETRVHRQIDASSYRLVFRNFFYDENQGKSILPLPPREGWHIAFDGEPALREVDGHAVVAVDYTFTGTLLGPEPQAVASDALLTVPGAYVEEPFVLPVDPEHILERTGYACMDESDFPPNSVDTENAPLFYDDTCEGNLTLENEGCHLTAPIPTSSCADAVRDNIGTVETAMRFERLAWNEATADAVRVGTQIPGVAELRAMPEGVQDNRIVYRYIPEYSCAISEGCVGGPGWRRLLQFTATVQNLGALDAALGDVSPGSKPVENNLVSLSACHNHMHFNHYGKFTFGDGTQQLGSKRAFCLESTWRYFNNEDTPFTHPYTCQFQGTAAGWGDDYIAGLDCQWVDITPVDTATAPVASTLAFDVNPDDFLCEGTPILDASGEQTYEPTSFTNEAGQTESKIACEETPGAADDNIATAPVTVPVGTGGMVTEACKRGQVGPKRNCGFAAVDSGRGCTPGEQVNLSCTGGSASAPVAVRVCEASSLLGAIPCTFLDALGTVTATDTATTVSFTCPASRSQALGEYGGRFGIYVSPMVDGDTANVTCTVQ